MACFRTALVAMLLFSLCGSAAAQVRFSEEEVRALTNAERLAAGAPPLAADARLSLAAQHKAEHLAREGYYAHVSPDGITPMNWVDGAGYAYRAVGENLAVNSLAADAEDIVIAFMESPGHRDNLLGLLFADLGVGIATGTYEGKEAVFTVQLFAAPREALAPAGPAAPEPAGAPLEEALEELRTGIENVPRPAEPDATPAAASMGLLPGLEDDPFFGRVGALLHPLVPMQPLPFSRVTTPETLAGSTTYTGHAYVSRFEPAMSAYVPAAQDSSLLAWLASVSTSVLERLNAMVDQALP